MREPKHFQELADNAFDFLEKASDQLEKEPKYSAINFFTGIELLLKARLLSEHWTLVYADPATAVKDGFAKGDFISVSLDAAIARLRKVVGTQISAKAVSAFDVLRQHRNQLMHFHHADYGPKPSKPALAQVAAEQCRAWFYLHSLLTKEFDIEFGKYKSRIQGLQDTISKKRSFLAFRFEELAPALEKGRKRGQHPYSCWACGYDASFRKRISGQLFDNRCLVCHHSHPVLIHSCENCGKPIEIEDQGYGKCLSCESECTLEGLVDHYQPIGADEIYCNECEEPNVVAWDDKWLCLNCLQLHTSFEQCGWCADMVTGEHELSSVFGCFLCPGSNELHRD